jgi:hypothetical protein
MRTFLICTLCAFALTVATVAAEESECDMKTVVKMRVCDDESRLLDTKDVVSGVTYYECEECDGRYAEPGDCPDCDESKLVKRKSGANVCKHCYGPTQEVEVCVKEYYTCPECGGETMAAGKCPDCEDPVTLVKQVSRSLITYQCDGCGSSSYTPGKCTDADCEDKGKDLVRRCSESGTMPHTR